MSRWGNPEPFTCGMATMWMCCGIPSSKPCRPAGRNAWCRCLSVREPWPWTLTTSRENGMEVRVRASNSDGEVLSEVAKLTLERKAEPKITTEPRSQTVRWITAEHHR